MRRRRALAIAATVLAAPGLSLSQGKRIPAIGLLWIESDNTAVLVERIVAGMAPNLSGVESADQARSVHLGELALDFAVSHLRDGGDLALKVFQGSGLAELQRALAARFDKVYVRKPKSSRDRSRETFLVAKGFVRKST